MIGKKDSEKKMDLNIVSKEKNPFLQREEIKFEISKTEKIPTRKEVRQKLAALTNSKEENLVVNKIRHKFGFHEVFGTARIYESKEQMKKTEEKFVLTRNFGKEEKKEGEQETEVPPPPPPKKDKSVEEKKE